MASGLRHRAGEGHDLHWLLAAADADAGGVPHLPAGEAAHPGEDHPGGDMVDLSVAFNLLVQVLSPAETEAVCHGKFPLYPLAKA